MAGRSDSSTVTAAAAILGTCLTVHLLVAFGVAGIIGALTSNLWLVAAVLAAIAVAVLAVRRARAHRPGDSPAPPD